MQIGRAGDLPPFGPHGEKDWEQQGGQQRDDSNDDQQFDQRKAAFVYDAVAVRSSSRFNEFSAILIPNAPAARLRSLPSASNRK